MSANRLSARRRMLVFKASPRASFPVAFVAAALVVVSVLGITSAAAARDRNSATGAGTPGTVVAGYEGYCALSRSGTVECWGDNDYGQLGNGTTKSSDLPVKVKGLAGVTRLIAGYEGYCALSRSGTVECWGDNDYGQLGNGTTKSSDIPVKVKGI